MRELAWETFATPVGKLSVACSAEGLAGVRFRPPPGASPGAPGPPPEAAALAGAAGRELAEYFAGQRRVFSLPVDWSAVPESHRRVLAVLRDSVGFGETVTYGTLADRAGMEDGASGVTGTAAFARGPGWEPPARVVGQIMASNPIPVIVPCHRVVAGAGIGGYSGGAGIEIKRWLLIFEGALPATLDWDPAGPWDPASPLPSGAR